MCVNEQRKSVCGRVRPSSSSPRSSHVCWNFPHGLRGILLRKLRRLACQRKAFYGHGSRCGQRADRGGGWWLGSQDKQKHWRELMYSKIKGRFASLSFFCAILVQQCATDSGGFANAFLQISAAFPTEEGLAVYAPTPTPFSSWLCSGGWRGEKSTRVWGQRCSVSQPWGCMQSSS